tara:strand:+ start:942 stop:1739 length:798 start_codon:yes stop_codon:yes gene_type:complete
VEEANIVLVVLLFCCCNERPRPPIARITSNDGMNQATNVDESGGGSVQQELREEGNHIEATVPNSVSTLLLDLHDEPPLRSFRASSASRQVQQQLRDQGNQVEATAMGSFTHSEQSPNEAVVLTSAPAAPRRLVSPRRVERGSSGSSGNGGLNGGLARAFSSSYGGACRDLPAVQRKTCEEEEAAEANPSSAGGKVYEFQCAPDTTPLFYRRHEGQWEWNPSDPAVKQSKLVSLPNGGWTSCGEKGKDVVLQEEPDSVLMTFEMF